ncbi:MAG: hypothetical protein JSS72_05285 [Armatimonadetes bacterium]|nr:hypothetical protein [Armatimonadota bacterium]
MKLRRTAATTLVELLVVIVVFLTGILAVARIFPGGIRLLAQSRFRLAAASLAADVRDELLHNSEDLPTAILPVKYLYQAGVVYVDSDPTRSPQDLGIAGNQINQSGMVLINGHPAGLWPYVSGANLFRRVIDDQYHIPSPRSLGGVDFGSLVTLRFGPVLTSSDTYASGLTYVPLFEIFGSEMEQIANASADGNALNYQYFTTGLDGDHAKIQLPIINGPSSGPANTFRVTFDYWVQPFSGDKVRRTFTGQIVPPSSPGGGYYTYYIVQPSGDTSLPGIITLGAGESLLSVDQFTIHVLKQFRQVTAFSTDPYEYKLTDWAHGLLLFNPAGFNTFQYTSKGRQPLIAKVSYDVYDWRILHENLSVADTANVALRVSSFGIKARESQNPDYTRFKGLNVPTLDIDPAQVDTSVSANTPIPTITTNPTVIVEDQETGAVVLSDEVVLDSVHGIIGFRNGVTKSKVAKTGLPEDATTVVLVVYPGQTGVSVQQDMTKNPNALNLTGRKLRVLYRANQEVAAQAFKASNIYQQTYSAPNVGQYYVGGSDGTTGGHTNRMYFPGVTVGQRVMLQQGWYRTGAECGSPTSTTQPTSLNDYSFVVQRPDTTDIPYPFVDLTEVDASACFDLPSGTYQPPYGYAVRGVKGVSLTARVVTNSGFLNLGNDLVKNLAAFEDYARNFRVASTQTFIQGGQQ